MWARMKILVFFTAVHLLSLLFIAEGAKTESGQECDSVCRRKGSKFWCHHGGDFSGWDYCSPDTAKSDSTDVITTHGLKCLDACTRQGDDAARCNTVSYKHDFVPYDWDYCSPVPGLDYKGRACSDACEFRGRSYKWCNIEGTEVKDPQSKEGIIESVQKNGRKIVDTVMSPFGFFAKKKWGYC